MPPYRRLSRTPVLLATMALLVLSACREQPSANVAVAQPQATWVSQGPSPPPGPREVPLCQVGSKELREGVRELAGKPNAVTHPSLLI